MRTARPIRSLRTAIFVVLATAAPLAAQVQLRDVSVTPVSTLHPDYLWEGAESANGRFFAFASFGGGDFIRYDRNTKQWSTAKGVEIGGQARWSPDGRFLAFMLRRDRQRSIWILPMDSGTGMPRGAARRVTTGDASWPAWSPDGRRIAYASQDSGRFRLAIVPFNGGDATVLYDTRGAGADVAWSPDGKFLSASHGHAERLPRYWLRLNTETKRVDSFPVPAFRNTGYSPDGKQVAHFDAGNRIVVISSATNGRAVQRVMLPPDVRPTGWSRTPNTLTAIQYVSPAHIQRVSLPERRLESVTAIDSVAFGSAVRHSPDGSYLAYARNEGSSFRIHVVHADGSNERALGQRGIISQFRWSPSGKYIAYIRRTLNDAGVLIGGIRVVDVATGVDRELVRLKVGAMPGMPLAWRSDGEAVRYVWFPNGLIGNAQGTSPRELREVALAGGDRLLASIQPEGFAHFINDTLGVIRKSTGVEGLSLRTGVLRPLFNGSIRDRSEVGVSPDGSWLVFAANNGDGMYPQMVSIATGETRKVPYSLKGELANIFFHPDGRRLIAEACLSCVAPSFVEKWDIVEIPMNGDAPRVLTASQPSYKDHGFPHLSHDGRSIVFVAQQSYNTRMVTFTLPKP